MVRQILTFSRREVTTQRRVVQLQAVVDEAARFLRATLPAQLEIVVAGEGKLPTIEADRTQLHQILINLATNAAHAMRDGRGTLELRTESVTLDDGAGTVSKELSPGRYVRLSVRDTGQGMDGQTLRRIFEPFFTTKGTAEGTGLGLAVVHGIVKSHGGAITVYSEPGKGTVFHLYFPAAGEALAESEPPPKEITAGRGERIVFVDDEVAIVALFTEILTGLGYQVAGFHQSEEALAAVRADPSSVDLVITDLSMPKLDGPALVRELRALRTDLPIVMATGFVGERDLAEAIRVGVTELLQKPYSRNVLAGVVHRALAGLRGEML